MKKLGHLNRDIARVLACLGHTDSIVIADCGLPVPPGVPMPWLPAALSSRIRFD